MPVTPQSSAVSPAAARKIGTGASSVPPLAPGANVSGSVANNVVKMGTNLPKLGSNASSASMHNSAASASKLAPLPLANPPSVANAPPQSAPEPGGAANPPSPVNQVVKNLRYRRDRAAKACEVCHARKVRCDMMENFPCTNCRAFNLTCKPRQGRSKSRKSVLTSVDLSDTNVSADPDSPPAGSLPTSSGASSTLPRSNSPPLASPFTVHLDHRSRDPAGDYVYHPSGVPYDISAQESRQTRYADETSVLRSMPSAYSRSAPLISTEPQPEDETLRKVFAECTTRIYYPMCHANYIAVKAFGAFLTPTPELSDHLIELYFKYQHPMVPVLNKREFLKVYRADRDKPSLLIRQAIWCAASRICDHRGVIDEQGTSRGAYSAFYRRAKALFDLNYESNQVNMICAATILTLAVSNPLYFNNSSLHWVHIAITLSQSLGLHRRLNSLPMDQQRQQRRIWWTLYRRDVSAAVTYGRPNMIRLEDCNIDMVTVNDFVGSETEVDEQVDPNSETGINVLTFLQSVKLQEISNRVIKLRYTADPDSHRQNVLNSHQNEQLLTQWVAGLPPQLHCFGGGGDNPGYSFVRLVLHLEYYTVLCLMYREQFVLLFKGNASRETQRSAAVGFQTTQMIVKIIATFQEHQDVRMLPGSAVFSLFCGVIFMSFQRRLGGNNPAVAKAVSEGHDILRSAAHELARSHSVASWVVMTADNLQSEELQRRIARSLRQSKNPPAYAPDQEPRVGPGGNVRSNSVSNPSLPNQPPSNHMSGPMPNQASAPMPNQMQGQHPNQHPNQISSQLPSQHLNQPPNQLPNQHPNQLPNQHPNQLPNQYPNQHLSQHSNQLPNQMPNQMQNQIAGQMPNQIHGQVHGQAPNPMHMHPGSNPMRNPMHNQIHGQMHNPEAHREAVANSLSNSMPNIASSMSANGTYQNHNGQPYYPSDPSMMGNVYHNPSHVSTTPLHAPPAMTEQYPKDAPALVPGSDLFPDYSALPPELVAPPQILNYAGPEYGMGDVDDLGPGNEPVMGEVPDTMSMRDWCVFINQPMPNVDSQEVDMNF